MKDTDDVTAVVIGCGPVGLCAVLAAMEFKPKNLFAVDAVEERLEQARRLGAEPLNFKTDPEGMRRRVMEVTGGRGADVVIEVVGLSPALRTAFDLVRPFGVISSIGVHNGEVRLPRPRRSEHEANRCVDTLERTRRIRVSPPGRDIHRHVG